jgi:hypothetical protein
MTQIEISRKLAQDAELEPKKADAIIQAIAEYTQSVAPVTREYLDAKLADLRSEMHVAFRDQTWKLVGSFVVVVLAATVIQHYWH